MHVCMYVCSLVSVLVALVVRALVLVLARGHQWEVKVQSDMCVKLAANTLSQL